MFFKRQGYRVAIGGLTGVIDRPVGGESTRAHAAGDLAMCSQGVRLDSDFSGYCFDEEARSWTVYGESLGYASSEVEEEEDDESDGDGEPDDQR